MVQGWWLLDSGATSFPPVSALGGRATNQMQPVGFLASWCHLLLFPPGSPCWAYQCSLLFWSQPGIPARKCPFVPSNGPWPLPVTLSAQEQPHSVSRHRLVLPGLHPELQQPVQESLLCAGGCCPAMVTQLERGVLGAALLPGCSGMAAALGGVER